MPLRPKDDATIRCLHAEGKSWRDIAQALGVHESTVFRRGRKIGVATSPSEGCKRAWSDPEKRARRLAARKNPRIPDELSPQQIEDYRTYRRAGYRCDEALAALGIAQ